MLLRRRILTLSASLRNYNSGHGGDVLSTSLSPSPSPFSTFTKDSISGDVLVREVKSWFKRDVQLRSHQLIIDRIFDILRAPSTEGDDRAFYIHLSSLRLRLSEKFVLDVLEHTRHDILSCLKFFDWAARQPGFHHTRATFHAIFKILRRAKLANLMFDFLDRSVGFEGCRPSLRLCDALVMGYAVAGRTDIALQHFGHMRFRGLDLDSYGYHVLLNALVEEKCFDTVDVIFDQISARGFVCAVTHSIWVKKLCKQGQLDEAEAYLRDLLPNDPSGCGSGLGVLINALCSKRKFHEATQLLDDIKVVGTVNIDRAYSIWIRALIGAGFLNNTAVFLQQISPLEGCELEVFGYNALISQLLKEHNLGSVYDILTEMMVRGVLPNKKTMNSALCFFCKAGLVEEALELYRSRSEIGFAPTPRSYSYLIQTLCADRRVEQAYDILKGAMDRGLSLGSHTFCMLTNALCWKGKVDMAMELVIVASERDLLPKRLGGCEIISVLCNVGKVQDALLINDLFNKSGVTTTCKWFISLIYGSITSMRGDIAAKLLIRMQEKGYIPTRNLYRNVIRCVCAMENGDKSLFTMLKFQLSLYEHKAGAYNLFIEGAGYAGNPKLARLVYDMMDRDGITPTLDSNILMLQSYLKNEKIADALHFFHDLREKGETKKRLYHAMVGGLCKTNRLDDAMYFLEEMKDKGMQPSIECYEVNIQKLCNEEKYEEAVGLVNEFRKSGRGITSFIGNVLLHYAMKSKKVYEAWTRMRDVEEKIPEMKALGELIGVFSGRIDLEVELKRLDEIIEKCYPLDMYTYNMLLKMVVMNKVEDAYEMVERIERRGYVPNELTDRILERADRILRGRNSRSNLPRTGLNIE
ncbi:Pentatricopeptide repeat-containing protein [Cardamine amara subsp. amara]|uniref:Pentatricopeptide repeat-containing protein n=1 Tax=Cardamine amara subsp. amara TaxID=228776 RepID=A0ABD1AS45_CARAN